MAESGEKDLMFRCAISQLLCFLLVLTVPTPVSGKGSNQQNQPTVQEKLVLMEHGSVVDVKTKAKEKITGRLGALASDSFEIQVAKGRSIENRSIRFDDVESVSKHGEHSARNAAGKATIGILVGAGVVLVAAGVAVLVLILIVVKHAA